MRTLFLSTLLILISSSPAFGYYSVLNTGDILPEGKYTATGETQFLMDPGGINLGAKFDSGINESTGFRADLGFGKTDLSLGAFVKYIPYPDVEGQPAVGLNSGIIYATDAGINVFTVRFEPLVSKKFETSFGHLVPYASVPVGLAHRSKRINNEDKNDLAIQIVGGTEIKHRQLNGVKFMAEVGIDIDNAFSYVSLAGVFDFDSTGFHIETLEE